MLKGKKILLGITGSIAAYKTISLVRELVKNGADVRVVMTPSALSFVTALTIATLSKNPVHSAYVSDETTGEWTNHVELGKWADLMVIAPLSANTLAKLVTGECDNLLLAVVLSLSCPLMVAPAMDLDMSDHITTVNNLQSLKERGVNVLDFDEGELASGLIGKGRMKEPEIIFREVDEYFDVKSNLKGRKLLVTAGPTYESIDPVRFIGNHSSGKMGFAIAQEAAERGANVVLVSGPTHLETPTNVLRVNVISALDMFNAVNEHFPTSDSLIMSAAVADYRPASIANQKLKKESGSLESIELEPTQDILAYCGQKKEKQILVGFALETDNELANAKKKLENKNLDMLVLNSLRDEGAGFGTDTNKVTFVFRDKIQKQELKSKLDVAKDILDELEQLV
jgi:phosphopantothenoylcysteine decarboxylase / phosphopantothenate---cysteine ligase